VVGRYALVVDGVVDSIVKWDGDRGCWSPPDDVEAVCVDDYPHVGVGWAYVDGAFEAPPPPPGPDPEIVDAQAVLAQLLDPEQPDPEQGDVLVALARLAVTPAE
jgi:hypothetical protein